MEGFILGLALKQRRKATRKSPIIKVRMEITGLGLRRRTTEVGMGDKSELQLAFPVNDYQLQRRKSSEEFRQLQAK